MARFEDTGPLSRETWPRARPGRARPRAPAACGATCATTHPSGIFRFAHIPVSTWRTGDVFARAYVRWLEIAALGRLHPRAAASAARRAPSRSRVGAARARTSSRSSLVEGWRGEICHVALTDAAGRFARYKVVDPSFHNWIGPGAGAARPADLRFPALQQELQPLLLRTRPVSAADREACSNDRLIRARFRQGHRTIALPRRPAAGAAGPLPRPPVDRRREVPATAAAPAPRPARPARSICATGPPHRPRPLPVLHRLRRAPAPRARSDFTQRLPAGVAARARTWSSRTERELELAAALRRASCAGSSAAR